MRTRWKEVPADIGAAIWNALRIRMGTGPANISVYETFSDPEGEHGPPTMLTVVGTKEGHTPLLRCVSTGERNPTLQALGVWVETRWTSNRYFVPDGIVPEEDL